MCIHKHSFIHRKCIIYGSESAYLIAELIEYSTAEFTCNKTNIGTNTTDFLLQAYQS